MERVAARRRKYKTMDSISNMKCQSNQVFHTMKFYTNTYKMTKVRVPLGVISKIRKTPSKSYGFFWLLGRDVRLHKERSPKPSALRSEESASSLFSRSA